MEKFFQHSIERHHQLDIVCRTDKFDPGHIRALDAIDPLWRTAIGQKIGKVRATARQLLEDLYPSLGIPHKLSVLSLDNGHSGIITVPSLEGINGLLTSSTLPGKERRKRGRFLFYPASLFVVFVCLFF